jgi:PAS domain S-box-containing protein
VDEASDVQFRAVFERAGIGMALVDRDGRLKECNPAFQEMLGRSGEELRGRRLSEFIHPGDTGIDQDLYEELVAGKRDCYALEKRYVHKSGETVRGCQTVSLIPTGGRGENWLTIAVVEDVTAREQAQAASIQAEKLALAERLVASLTHEVSNPLQAAALYLGLARRSLAAGEGVGDRLQIAAQELERAFSIVVRLRDQNRPLNLEDREPTDVSLLLEQVLAQTRERCEEQRVEVARKEVDGPVRLMLAPGRVQQAFVNLVINGVQAMPGGGRLEIGVVRTAEPEGACITFTDTGHGIAPDVLPHVFDPFYTTRPEGLGLGLYLTRNVVEGHGGNVEVKSRRGEGATFKVWLPA